MLKIGEFSRLTQVTVRMLRYYDEMGLLKPSKIDKFTGYRLYTVEQIPIINKIIFLRDLGFTVAEISQAIHHWEDGYINHILLEKQKEIEGNVKNEQHKLEKIRNAILDSGKEKAPVNYNVMIKSIPSYNVISYRKIISNYFHEGLLWKQLGNLMDANGIKAPNNPLSIALYHDGEYKEKDVDVEVVTVVEKLGESKDGYIFKPLEGVEMMASTMVYGPFENIASAYLSFVDWLNKHSNYNMDALPDRQICHRGPWNEEHPEKYLTEIQIPIISK